MTETHAIYIAITPSPTAINSSAEIQKAMASQAKWGGLHITITSFALRHDLAHKWHSRMNRRPHVGSLAKVVQSTGVHVKSLGGWHPSDSISADMWGAQQLTRRTFASGERAVFIRSSFLNELVKSAGKARHSKPLNSFHVTIGQADFHLVEAMLLDPATKYTLCVAVRRTSPDIVVRYVDRVALWPPNGPLDPVSHTNEPTSSMGVSH